MSHFDRDIEIDVIVTNHHVHNKQQCMTLLADVVAKHTELQAPAVRAALEKQESRATSTHGNGLAIPELRMGKTTSPLNILIRLDKPIPFNAIDGQNVDLICLVLSPNNTSLEYLRRLSRVTRVFNNADLCQKIRETKDEQSIRALIHSPDGWMMAAA